MKVTWRGVIPAVTTPLNEDYSVDHGLFAEQCRWMIDSGCTGVVPLGSLGEGATLLLEEKAAVLKTAVQALEGRAPVIAGIAALSTAEAVRLARAAQDAGCSGLMALPPYVYSTDWREMKAHIVAVLGATDLPVMLYNNPPAYKTDFVAEQIAELAAEFPNLEAVKESSGDVRRVMAIRALVGDRLTVLVGLDDAVVEGVQMGAQGWIGGLTNAFPRESVALFDRAVAGYQGGGDRAQLDALYRWFLPLLRLDTLPKFVQLIKLAQELVGRGSARVRPPRLELVGAELDAARQLINTALEHRPQLT
jgi:4-hydroxy-tetrahydrodipicolinate synthase